jgi:methylphosphotriester-DNA--protein-cysteine methyltransferase
MVKKAHQSQFHRSQIGRAQRYFRLHLAERVSLSRIAREAGSSSYHFARLFPAYVGETPFEFLRRIRLVTQLPKRLMGAAGARSRAWRISFSVPAEQGLLPYRLDHTLYLRVARGLGGNKAIS